MDNRSTQEIQQDIDDYKRRIAELSSRADPSPTGEAFKMSRLNLDASIRMINGGQPPSPTSSSDSETATSRDRAAQNLSLVDFLARPQPNADQEDKQGPRWDAGAAGQPNVLIYDPTFSYASGGAAGYTAESSIIHEMQHNHDDSHYQHPDHPDYRGINLHLPGSDPNATDILQPAEDRQTKTIKENWSEVANAINRDPGIANSTEWAQYVMGRVDYARRTPHQHNESVANQLLNDLARAGLSGGAVGNQLRVISSEAERRRLHGGEVARIEAVAGSSSTRTSAYTNTLGGVQGKQRAK